MSKNQNHGKMKEWRKPEFKRVDNGVYKETVLVKQEPHKRRKTKGQSFCMKAWMSPLLEAMFKRVGLINKEAPQV